MLTVVLIRNCFLLQTVGAIQFLFGFSNLDKLHYENIEQLLLECLLHSDDDLWKSAIDPVYKDNLLDYRYTLSVCNLTTESPVPFSTSLQTCFSDVNQTSIPSRFLHLPSLILTHFSGAVKDNTSDTNYNSLVVKLEINAPSPSLVIAEDLNGKKWTDFIIITDDYAANQQDLEKLLTYLGSLGMKTSMFTIETDIPMLMSTIDKWRQVHKTFSHILMCDINNTISILQEAMLLGMSSNKYLWLVYNSDNFESLLPYLDPSENLAIVSANGHTVYNEAKKVYHKIVRLKRETEEIYKQHNSSLLSNIKLQQNTSGIDISADLYDSIMNKLEASTAIIRKHSSEPLYEITSSTTQKPGELEMEKVGHWDRQTALQISNALFQNSHLKYTRFNKRVFTVCSLEYSFFAKKQYQADGTVKWVGLTFELMDELAYHLNFSYVVVEPPDGQWGTRDENGTWNGMIGMVHRNEIDFAAAGFSVTADRDTVVDFTTPFFEEQSTILLRRSIGRDRFFFFVYLLNKEIWYGILGVLLFCTVVLYVLTKASPFYECGDNAAGSQHGLFHFNNALFYMCGVILTQGSNYAPVSQSGRMVAGFFCIFCVVMTTSFTGNLMALFTVSITDMPFKTLHEMAQQSAFKWFMMDGKAMAKFLREAKNEPYLSLNKDMHYAKSFPEALRMVKEENYAMLADKSWSQMVVAGDDNCGLSTTDNFFPTDVAMVFQSGSPYLSLFSETIDKIGEAGLLKKWVKDWTPRNMRCEALVSETEAKAATLKGIRGAVYLSLMGIGLAVIVLFLEICCNICMRAIKKRKSREGDILNMEAQN